MKPRALLAYLDDMVRCRRPKPFRANDFEAAQIRTAIDLQSVRMSTHVPRQEFLTDLWCRLAEQLGGR
jgi:cytochrome b6-f complex iron-sulfur subunit